MRPVLELRPDIKRPDLKLLDLKLLGSIALLACFAVPMGSASANSANNGKPALRGASGVAPKPLTARTRAYVAPAPQQAAPQYVAPQPAPHYAPPQAAGHPQPAPGAYGAQLHDANVSQQPSGAALFAGCYAGVHGSGMRNDVKSTERHPDYTQVPQQKFIMNSVGAGVQLGCNFVQQDMVFGVEAEGMFPISSRGEATYMKFGKTMETNLLNAKEQATYAIALRAGIVADRTLYYAKLGFAHTSMELDQKYEHGTFVNKTEFTNYTRLTTRGEFSKISYVFGGGAEYAIDANWSVKGEYNLIVTQKDELVAAQTGAGVTRTTVLDNPDTADTNEYSVTNTPITGASRVKSVSNLRNVFKIGVNRRF